MNMRNILTTFMLAVALLGCGKQQTARQIVILPDVSGSIDKEAEEEAFKAIDELISHLRRGDRVNLSVNRQIGILLVLKRFYRYLKEERSLAVLDPEEIRPPRRPRKEVAYLTAEEVERFVSIIKIENHRGYSYVAGLRFRALVETILGSAMRISEVLSLNRNQIDFKRAQATIIGKGRKERTVFFTDRALLWIERYLDTRADTCSAVFVCQDGKARLKRTDVWRPFTKYRKLSGIEKKVTPHLLRHTAATQLLFNGCPVGHIKEILGHERLETTCRYYLGLDHRAAQAAHRKYLTYSSPAA
jgi:integrase/recombinase XerD